MPTSMYKSPYLEPPKNVYKQAGAREKFSEKREYARLLQQTLNSMASSGQQQGPPPRPQHRVPPPPPSRPYKSALKSSAVKPTAHTGNRAIRDGGLLDMVWTGSGYQPVSSMGRGTGFSSAPKHREAPQAPGHSIGRSEGSGLDEDMQEVLKAREQQALTEARAAAREQKKVAEQRQEVQQVLLFKLDKAQKNSDWLQRQLQRCSTQLAQVRSRLATTASERDAALDAAQIAAEESADLRLEVMQLREELARAGIPLPSSLGAGGRRLAGGSSPADTSEGNLAFSSAAGGVASGWATDLAFTSDASLPPIPPLESSVLREPPVLQGTLLADASPGPTAAAPPPSSQLTSEIHDSPPAVDRIMPPHAESPPPTADDTAIRESQFEVPGAAVAASPPSVPAGDMREPFETEESHGSEGEMERTDPVAATPDQAQQARQSVRCAIRRDGATGKYMVSLARRPLHVERPCSPEGAHDESRSASPEAAAAAVSSDVGISSPKRDEPLEQDAVTSEALVDTSIDEPSGGGLSANRAQEPEASFFDHTKASGVSSVSNPFGVLSSNPTAAAPSAFGKGKGKSLVDPFH